MSDEEKLEKRSPAIPLKIFEGGYTLVPAFWTKMMGVVMKFDPHTGQPIPQPVFDKHIPASFWKYSLVLWRDVVGINCVQRGFTAKKTMQDFAIRPATAMRWTAAYMASGLFDIKLGARHVKGVKGSPSTFRYLNGTEYDWEVFMRCLSWLCSRDKRQHHSQEGSEGSIAAFRCELTWAIAVVRMQEIPNSTLRQNLSNANEAFLNQCMKDGVARMGPRPQEQTTENWLHRLQVTRTATNRFGVIEKRDQALYYDLELDGDQSVISYMKQRDRENELITAS